MPDEARLYHYSAFGTHKDARNSYIDGFIQCKNGKLTMASINELKEMIMEDYNLAQKPTIISLAPIEKGEDDDAKVTGGTI